MKLFTKISIIVALIALGLGVLGVCIGLAMGADAEDLSELGIYISPHQTVAVSEVISEVEEEIREETYDVVEEIVEESFYVYHDEGLGHHGKEENNYRPHNERLHEHTHSLKGIERLDIEVRNAEITMFATEDVEELLYYSDHKKDIATVDGTTLKLEDRTSIHDKIQLELYIPIGVLEEIEIEAAAGIVTADKIVVDSVTMEIDAASVQIGELQVTREAQLHVEAGEIVVGYYDGPRLDVDCALGSVTVVCEGNEFDYNYEMECGMGQIVYGKESYSLIGEKIRHNDERSKNIEAECEMGEIIFEFSNSL